MEYAALVDVYRRLEATDSNLAKTAILADAFAAADDEHLPLLVTLVRGRAFAAWEPDELGVSSSLTTRAVSRATGVDGATIEDWWRETGDLGDAAARAVEGAPQRTLVSPELDVRTVHGTLRELADYEGEGSQGRRVDAVAGLVSAADPDAARYVVRTVLGHLRVGVGDGTVRDAIAAAFLSDPDGSGGWDSGGSSEGTGDADGEGGPGDGSDPRVSPPDEAVAAVERAFQVTNDYRVVARTARDEGLAGLEALDVELFRPVRAMLAEKADGLAAAVRDVADRPADVLVEYKYDGARLSVHVDGDEVRLFTRRQADVTAQFPDVVAAVEAGVDAGTAIVDGEVVGYDPATGRPVPFQEFSRRIEREHDVEATAEEVPVVYHAFDLLYVDGESLLDAPLRDRLAELEDVLAPVPGRIERAEARRVAGGEEAADDGEEAADEALLDPGAPDADGDAADEGALDTDGDAADEAVLAGCRAFYEAALSAGHEGVMAKNLAATHQPGRRVGSMAKVKPVMEPLDLAVVGAQWSEGRRSEFLGRLFLGAYDPDADAFRDVGRLSTGYTDEELRALTDRLEPLIVDRDGRRLDLRPEVVLGVEYEAIQRSPEYDSGYALRFPRFLGVREDLAPEDADTVERVERLFESQ